MKALDLHLLGVLRNLVSWLVPALAESPAVDAGLLLAGKRPPILYSPVLLFAPLLHSAGILFREVPRRYSQLLRLKLYNRGRGRHVVTGSLRHN